MGLIYHHKKTEQGVETGIWDIAESEEWFLLNLQLMPEEEDQLSKIKGFRRLEWLAARQLVHFMSGHDNRKPFYKDSWGKPHLTDSDLQISISHSHGLAAASTGTVPLGIDIQLPVEKITRLAPKFLHESEAACLSGDPTARLLQLHVFWGAKEALYKAYGRKQLDYRAHIRIEPFDWNSDGGTIQGKIETDTYKAWFNIHFSQILESYVLVEAVQTAVGNV